MEVNIVVSVVVSDRVVVAASVVDDGAIVEDGGEVLWKSKLLFISSFVVSDRVWLLHRC